MINHIYIYIYIYIYIIYFNNLFIGFLLSFWFFLLWFIAFFSLLSLFFFYLFICVCSFPVCIFDAIPFFHSQFIKNKFRTHIMLWLTRLLSIYPLVIKFLIVILFLLEKKTYQLRDPWLIMTSYHQNYFLYHPLKWKLR